MLEREVSRRPDVRKELELKKIKATARFYARLVGQAQGKQFNTIIYNYIIEGGTTLYEHRSGLKLGRAAIFARRGRPYERTPEKTN